MMHVVTHDRLRPVVLLGLVVTAFAGASCSPSERQASEPSGPRFYHTVRFDIRPDADSAALERVLGMMRQLGEKLDVVESYVVGPDLSEEYDVGATYVIRGYDGYRAYLYDSLHLEIDKAGLPLVQSMVSFDITDDLDPQAMAKIAEIHRRRIDEVPGLAELLRQMESYQGAGVDRK
jgi:Stress responsive A/B Barrel Domain